MNYRPKYNLRYPYRSRDTVVRQGIGDAVVTCPPGLTLQNGVCTVPPPTVFQRIGSAVTGFFNTPGTVAYPPGYVPPTTGITDSPLFLPAVIGGGLLLVVMLRNR